jgi:hypothetical protein
MSFYTPTPNKDFSRMQSNTNTIAQSTDEHEDNTDPRFVVWCYPSGLMTVAVEGSGDNDVDGETLLSWHEYAGCEIGPSSIFAASGDAILLVFRGTYEDQKTFFDQWDQQAKENDRPAIFLNEGVEGLVGRGPTVKPPLPEIDPEQTSHANEVLRVSRERMWAAGLNSELTLEACQAIVDQVAKELDGALQW